MNSSEARDSERGKSDLRVRCVLRRNRLLSVGGVTAQVAVLVAMSCAAPPPGVLSHRSRPNQELLCPFAERSEEICRQLRGAKLLDETGGELDAAIEKCGVVVGTADVTWIGADFTGGRFRALLQFGQPRGSLPLRLVTVEPVVFRWPSDTVERFPGLVESPVLRQCPHHDLPAGFDRAEVPRRGLRVCRAVGRMALAAPDWCENSGDWDEVYRYREGRWGSMDNPRELLEVRLSHAGEAEVRVNGEALAVSDAQAQDVREMLGNVWSVPSEVAEGCRDGGVKSLLAQRSAEWKVVLRHCSVIEPVEAVLDLLRRE